MTWEPFFLIGVAGRGFFTTQAAPLLYLTVRTLVGPTTM